MTKQYFEDFEEGDSAESIGRTVSESDLYTFAGLTGSYGEIHTNKEHMKDTRFGRRLVQGVLLLTYVNGFSTMLPWEPDTVALYGIDHVRFINPVFLDDTVHLETEVTETEPRDDDTGLVTFKHELLKQDGETAMVCDWKELLHRAP